MRVPNAPLRSEEQDDLDDSRAYAFLQILMFALIVLDFVVLVRMVR